MKAKKFLSVLFAVIIMSAVTCFGIISASAEEVSSAPASDSATDSSDPAGDEDTGDDITGDEDITDDTTDGDFAEDENTGDITEDDMADTEDQTQGSESPTTGDTATPISALALVLALGGTAVAGYKLKKAE